MAKKKNVPTEKSTVGSAKGLFDHINAIYQDQRKDYFSTLTDGDKRTYSNYMVNRFLSMNVHQLPLVDEIQKYNIPSEAHYLFYATTIPRGKQFNKYIKSKSEDKYEKWLVELVAKHYMVSQDEAIFYLDIYYDKDKPTLKELCEKYAVDPKVIKKAKL
jgi:hypothetical protein